MAKPATRHQSLTRTSLIFAALAAVVITLVSAAAVTAFTKGDGGEPSHQAVVDVRPAPVSPLTLRDELAMVLIGTALIGLGAAVRRAR
jgi:hypothetical protein